MKHTRPLLLLLLLLSLPACVYDGAGLEERQCIRNVDCTPPHLCIYGLCQPSTASVPDADGPDAPADVDPTDADPPDADLTDAPLDADPPDDASPDTDPPDDASPDADPPDGCLAALEICDREDNDCDGKIDEDLNDGLIVGDPCTSGDGVCAEEGLVLCASNGRAVCSSTPDDAARAEESCDGDDNDCDGLTDEAPDGTRLSRPCDDYPDAQRDRLGIGVCAEGLQRCQEGAWTACIGQVLPAAEVCDGLDNDCDGTADEPPCSASGCADGQREGFTNLNSFPDLAACSGAWSGTPPLRAGQGGASDACGDTTGVTCANPADLCASGWVVCGFNGDLDPLRRALGGASACSGGQAGAGRWVAAASHCDLVPSGCSYPPDGAPLECGGGGRCSEAVCCGQSCNTPGCRDALFPGGTLTHQGNGTGCGAMPADQVSGVLCCRP